MKNFELIENLKNFKKAKKSSKKLRKAQEKLKKSSEKLKKGSEKLRKLKKAYQIQKTKKNCDMFCKLF